MKKFALKLKGRFLNKEYPMEYRISMIFFMVAFFASILSATTNTILGKGIFGLIFQWSFIALMIAFFFAPIKIQHRFFKPLVLLVCFIYIPFLFTQTAGYDGTALMFSLLGIFIICVAFSKKERVLLLIANILILLALCFLEFLLPDSFIVPHDGEQAKFLDQLVALIVTAVAMAIFSIYILGALKKSALYAQNVVKELEQKNENLVEIAQIFNHLRYDDESMKKSMDLAGVFLKCDSMIFWSKNPDGNTLVPEYTWNQDGMKEADTALKSAIIHQKIQQAFGQNKKKYLKLPHNSSESLLVPIYADGNIWGIIEFILSNDKWSNNDMRLAIILSSIYSTFLERRKYEASLEKQLMQQTLSAKIAGNFINTIDFAGRVNQSITALGDFLHCERVDIYQIAENEKTGSLKNSWSKNPDYQEQVMTDECIVKICQVFINQHQSYLTEKRQYNQNNAWYLMVPYSFNNHFCGVIRFIRNGKDSFEDHEIQLALMFGATYSVVLERIHQDEVLVEARITAETASLAKSNFLSNMSHEMRTPINAIIGMTQIGLMGGAEKAVSSLQNIKTSSSQLLGIINDILDMAKIESGKVELEKITFDLQAELANIHSIVNTQAEVKKISFEMALGNSLKTFYIGDKTKITQIIMNLLSNAIKFTDIGGKVKLAVDEIAEYSGQARIQVIVSDNGVGMNNEEMQRIFSAFEQGDNSINRRFGGTGLGLSIVRNLVSLMSGTISVKSTPMIGSEFSADFLLDIPNDNNNSFKQLIEANDEDNIADYRGINILVVEDIEINCEIIVSLLEPTKAEVDMASNGVEAIEMFKNNPQKYDIILMDIQMPVMDGLETTKIIRSLEYEKVKTIPIIALTANVFKEDIDKYLTIGMNDHIGKPIDIKRFYKVLKKHLHKP